MTAITTEPVRQGQAEILLESGTNELEVLVFYVGANAFGVNVAKVREVILPQTVAASPRQPACVLGMFNLRGKVLPLVDLHKYLNLPPTDANPKNRRIIVTEFNGVRAAFLVEKVDQIFRMSWSSMKPVPQISERHGFAVTGITEINNHLVLMLDFESILDHISMQDKLHVTSVENKLGVDRAACRVFVVEDSMFIREIMISVLTKSGYGSVEAFPDGLRAWQALQAAQTGERAMPTLVVADIEMPQMDGLALTRHIKEDPNLRHLPVVLFSSLITDDTRHKGTEVGADEQISKPQLPDLVNIVDGWAKKALAASQG